MPSIDGCFEKAFNATTEGEFLASDCLVFGHQHTVSLHKIMTPVPQAKKFLQPFLARVKRAVAILQIIAELCKSQFDCCISFSLDPPVLALIAHVGNPPRGTPCC